MNYTEEQRAGIASVFKLAKHMLENRMYAEYICILIEYYIEDNPYADLAREIVQSRVKPERLQKFPDSSLEFWVSQTLPEKQWKDVIRVVKRFDGSVWYAEPIGKFGDNQMRLFRIRWLEELIREFS